MARREHAGKVRASLMAVNKYYNNCYSEVGCPAQAPAPKMMVSRLEIRFAICDAPTIVDCISKTEVKMFDGDIILSMASSRISRVSNCSDLPRIGGRAWLERLKEGSLLALLLRIPCFQDCLCGVENPRCRLTGNFLLALQPMLNVAACGLCAGQPERLTAD